MMTGGIRRGELFVTALKNTLPRIILVKNINVGHQLLHISKMLRTTGEKITLARSVNRVHSSRFLANFRFSGSSHRRMIYFDMGYQVFYCIEHSNTDFFEIALDIWHMRMRLLEVHNILCVSTGLKSASWEAAVVPKSPAFYLLSNYFKTFFKVISFFGICF